MPSGFRFVSRRQGGILRGGELMRALRPRNYWELPVLPPPRGSPLLQSSSTCGAEAGGHHLGSGLSERCDSFRGSAVTV